MEQVRRQRDDFVFHLAQARKAEGIERVLEQIELGGFAQDLVHVMARRVDEAEGASAAPVGVGALALAHAREQLVFRDAFLGQRHGDSSSRAA